MAVITNTKYFQRVSVSVIIDINKEIQTSEKNFIKKTGMFVKEQKEILLTRPIPYKKKQFSTSIVSVGNKEVVVKNILACDITKQPYYMRGKFINTNTYFYWYASANDTNATESGYQKSSFQEIVLVGIKK
jgi:hypothetical protein